MKTAAEFSAEAERRGTRIGVHVKVDTGMGRMGLEDASDVQKIAALPGISLEGLMSHLSDADLADRTHTDLQTKRFSEIVSHARASGLNPVCHLANSAASLSLAESHFDAIRPGLSLYGISPFESADDKWQEKLKPVMSILAKVLAIRRMPKGSTISYGRTFTAKRDTLAAVMAVGYADGYMRALSNTAHVLIKGRRAPVAGRVCMDLTVADVTGIAGVSEGDDAVLLGRAGSEEITAWELASKSGTIPYETLLSLGKAAHRVEHTA
jgi:alanine racemase